MLEFLPDQLDLFTQKPLMLGVLDNEILECNPLNSLDNAANIDFQSHAFPDRMKDLSHMYLKLKLKLVKTDGKDYAIADTVQPYLASNALHSIFKSAFISLNGVNLQSQENGYNYKEYLETGLNFNVTTLENRLSTQFFATKDTRGTLAKVSANGKTFDLYGKINLCNVSKLLLPGVSLALRFNLETPDSFIIETTTTSTLKILEAKLMVRHVSIAPELMLSIERQLSSGKMAQYEYTRGQIVSINVPAGISSLNVTNFYNGIRPNLILFMMTTHKAFIGDRSLSPFKFESFNLNTFAFLVNGALKPPNSYNISMTDTEETYSQIFSKLYESLGYHNLDRSSIVSQENFKTDYFMIAHDLTAFSTALSDIQDPIQQVSLGVSGKFSSALTEPITCLMYLLLPTKFEISANRNVTLNY